MSRQARSAPSLRPTRQRTAISAALSSAGGFLTAQEIHEGLRSSGGRVGLTTVYRTLQALAESGEVDVVTNADREALYRRCFSHDHHHHLVCRNCGASVEVESPEVEEWAKSASSEHGFSEVTHTVEVYGLCRSCHS